MTTAPLLPLRADGQPVGGRVQKQSLWTWWLAGAGPAPGTRGIWLAHCPPWLLCRAEADLVFLACDGAVLAIHPHAAPWRAKRGPGARQALVLHPGGAAQWGLRLGQGLDLLA